MNCNGFIFFGNWIYYHNSSPLKIIDIQFLNECINFEVRIDGEVCSFLYLYVSRSETRDIFETFTDNFELTLDSLINQYLVILIQKQLTGTRMI